MTAATSLRTPLLVSTTATTHTENTAATISCVGVERAEVTGGGTCEDTRPGRDWAAGLAPAVMMSLLTAHSHMIQMIHCLPHLD